MAYGMQIYRSDGRLFASPDFTPYVLVYVKDQAYPAGGTSGQLTYQTTVPNAKNAVLFVRAINTDSGIDCQLVNGSSGYKNIVVYAMLVGNTATTFRFYIFSNYVAYVPPYGIAFYRDGAMVYCGNCLPLQLHSFEIPNSDPNPTVSKACIPALSAVDSNPLPGTNDETITILSGWCGTPSYGASSVPYEDIEGSIAIAGNISRTCLYIETPVYDQYYKQSLGY